MFDRVRDVSSIGSVAVAPSNPDVVYVGTGDMITAGTIQQGNGVYKSTDAGKTWQHLGLDRTKHIPSISVDPRNADVLLLAAAGDPHRKSEERGIFRSTDGGRTWTRVIYVDDETGGQFVTRSHDMPDTPCWDLAIKDNDLIVGAYGRGIWVLDNYALLRQLTPGMETARVLLFAASDAVRVRSLPAMAPKRGLPSE